MRPVVTDGVICLSVYHDHEPYKNGWTDRDTVWGVDSGYGPNEPCIRWVQISTHEEAILTEWSGRPRTCRRSIYSKWLDRGRHRYGGDADWDVLDDVHIGATWWIRLNRPCVAAMRPYVKLLWPLVCLTSRCLLIIITFRVSRRRREMYCDHPRRWVCLFVCVCLSAVARPHYWTDPDVTCVSGRDCSLVVHC